MTVLLDTHVWVWWLTPDSPLKRAERRALDAAAERQALSLSAISLWEAQMLHAKGRLALPMAFADWLTRATDERMVSTLPLDLSVVLALETLPRTFHGDPADRLIVATARAHGIALATHDSNIRRSRSVRIWHP